MRTFPLSALDSETAMDVLKAGIGVTAGVMAPIAVRHFGGRSLQPALLPAIATVAAGVGMRAISDHGFAQNMAAGMVAIGLIEAIGFARGVEGPAPSVAGLLTA